MKYRCYFVVTIAKNRSVVAEKFVPSIKLAIVVFKEKSVYIMLDYFWVLIPHILGN